MFYYLRAIHELNIQLANRWSTWYSLFLFRLRELKMKHGLLYIVGRRWFYFIFPKNIQRHLYMMFVAIAKLFSFCWTHILFDCHTWDWGFARELTNHACIRLILKEYMTHVLLHPLESAVDSIGQVYCFLSMTKYHYHHFPFQMCMGMLVFVYMHG